MASIAISLLFLQLISLHEIKLASAQLSNTPSGYTLLSGKLISRLLTTGYNFGGDNIKEINVTEQECIEACDINPECVAFVAYDYENLGASTCRLKSQLKNAEFSQETTVHIKDIKAKALFKVHTFTNSWTDSLLKIYVIDKNENDKLVETIQPGKQAQVSILEDLEWEAIVEK